MKPAGEKANSLPKTPLPGCTTSPLIKYVIVIHGFILMA